MVKAELKVTLVQSKLYWEDATKNLQHFNQLLAGVKAGSTDVIVLPEMFTTGFSMQAHKYAHTTNDFVFEWMFKTAKQKQAVLCGSIMFADNGKYYNRFVWMQTDGKTQYYDKRHLFSMGTEDKTYTAGQQPLVVMVNGVAIRPLICYDLRFPVYSRNTLNGAGKNLKPAYDVLLFVANWPHVRIDAWRSLLKARAIENACYCIGVNRIGKDANGMAHSGHSKVFNYKGEILHACKPDKTCVDTVTLRINELAVYRSQFAVLNDADNFSLKL
ncbi:MAG: amidohydrolase [Bacteroidia bacterium]|nr:amidohydrolase [Bacteroidia bacterium]HQU99835.1 amidohydrolase [Bacteroidia bacterium]